MLVGIRRSSRRRRLATAVACLALAAVAGATTPVAQATTSPLRYVALGDSYSAASGVLPPDLDRAAAVPALDPQLPARDRRQDRRAAHRRDLRRGGHQRLLHRRSTPAWRRSSTRSQTDTQLVTMTIGGNDSGVFINAILSCGAAGRVDARPGQPVQGPVRILVRGHHPHHDLPVARERPAGGPGQGAAGQGGASSATRGSCRRPAAASTRCRSRGATSPTCAASRRRSTTRSGAPPPRPARPT